MAVVAELQPPDGADLTPFVRAAEDVARHSDTIQLTDMPRATPHLDNLAATAVLRQRGLDVMVTMTCRDRNSIAQQARLLGAAALGASAVFCITGDPVEVGDHPRARAVFELRGSSWLTLARRLRDEGCYASGRAAVPPPSVMLGAALGPDGPKDPVRDAATKIESGAEFLMTQPVYDVPRFGRLMAELSARAITPRCPVVVGIAAPPTYEAARWLDEFPGIHVPEHLLAELRRTPSAEQARVGLEHARRIVEQLDGIPEVAGVLVYPVGPSTAWLVRVLRVVVAAAGRTDLMGDQHPSLPGLR